MSEMGDFWRDVRDARREAGLPARRRRKPRAEAPSRGDAKRFRAAGLEPRTEWHWQMRLAGDLLDFWPSRRKWQWRGEVKTGDWAELFALIAEHSPPAKLA